MADETQTDTTETQSSTETTTSSDASAPADKGGADATQSTGSTAEGDADQSLLGGAGTEAGSGDGSKDAGQADGDGEGAESAADGPPETYELSVTVKDAEGKDVPVEIDTALLEKATPLFKDAGLTNDQANKLAPLAMEIESRVLQQQADNFDAMKADWAKDAKADKEIGGAKFDASLGLAAKALDMLGFPKGSEFRKLLDDTGLGNHPDMIRAFARVGAKVGEDSDFVRSDATPPAKRDPLAEQYPDDVPSSQKQGAK